MGEDENLQAGFGESGAGGVFVSLTRLRLRSVRFVPGFVWWAFRTFRQAQREEGFRGGAILQDRQWTFWTMTGWDGPEAMRRYITTGDHKEAMPKLMEWCDEASVAHWEQESAALPGWEEADRRMRERGRVSKVRWPSAAHAGMRYRAPRVTRAVPIPKE